jgi:hypothetical protein
MAAGIVGAAAVSSTLEAASAGGTILRGAASLDAILSVRQPLAAVIEAAATVAGVFGWDLSQALRILLTVPRPAVAVPVTRPQLELRLRR